MICESWWGDEKVFVFALVVLLLGDVGEYLQTL
jgi:hypothetical protein